MGDVALDGIGVVIAGLNSRGVWTFEGNSDVDPCLDRPRSAALETTEWPEFLLIGDMLPLGVPDGDIGVAVTGAIVSHIFFVGVCATGATTSGCCETGTNAGNSS